MTASGPPSGSKTTAMMGLAPEGGAAFLLVLLICTGLRGADIVNQANYLRREHSLIRPFQGSGFGLPYWDFAGSTMVTSGYIRLTPNVPSQKGAVWNTAPVRFRHWQVKLQFRVTGTKKDLYGDGFAFWYARDRMIQGPVFGSRDFFSGLAVMADTYSNHNGPHNHNHPYVSAMVNNGSLQYDHDMDGTHTMIGGCEFQFRNKDQLDTYLLITYLNDEVTVSHKVGDGDRWTACLHVQGVRLPTGYYFGVSAETGELSDEHDVLSMKVYELEGRPEPGAAADGREGDFSQIVPSSSYFEPARDHVDTPKPSSMSGIKMFFLLLLGVLGCFGCVVIGIIIYQKQQEGSRKRFY